MELPPIKILLEFTSMFLAPLKQAVVVLVKDGHAAMCSPPLWAIFKRHRWRDEYRDFQLLEKDEFSVVERLHHIKDGDTTQDFRLTFLLKGAK